MPHDIAGLARLMGGKKAFVEKLQRVFDEKLYDPANEPDIAYPYLFCYFKGEEWRTQKLVSQLIDKYYGDRPDGIPGNDDCGTMSSWLVFSMMGLYPDCPGSPWYCITTPAFDRVTLHMNKDYYPGGDIVIERQSEQPSDVLIDRMTLGGRPLTSYRISHEQLIKNRILTIKTKKQ